MIEIDEPPDIRACAAHSVPLTWHYSARAGTWKAWEPVEEDPELMRRHRCEHHGDPLPSWREQRTFDPETFSRGMAKARDAIAAPQTSVPREVTRTGWEPACIGLPPPTPNRNSSIEKENPS